MVVTAAPGHGQRDWFDADAMRLALNRQSLTFFVIQARAQSRRLAADFLLVFRRCQRARP
jgi:hypothetical protein